MSADLGSWSRPQAQALVKVLKRAGIRASMIEHPGTSDVTVTVPSEQADRAHTAIAADMDTIARAARDAREREQKADVHRLDAARRRRGRGQRRAARSGSDGPPLASERLRRFAPLLGLLLVAVLVGVTVPVAVRFPVMVVAVLGVTYAIGRSRDGV